MRQLEVGETVILYDSDVPNQNYQIMCVLILTNLPENAPNDVFGFRYLSGAYPHLNNTHTTMYRRWLHNERFFRKINPRKNFDKASAMIKNRINNNTIGNVSDEMKKVLGNVDLTRNMIGPFLGPTPRRGGRRKRRVTRRTRKNKRKSTRRIRRKYKR